MIALTRNRWEVSFTVKSISNSGEVSPFDGVTALIRRIGKHLKLDERYPGENITERFLMPEKVIFFRLSLKRDSGSVDFFPCYRVQHSDMLGPYKGGIRLHPDGGRGAIAAPEDF